MTGPAVHRPLPAASVLCDLVAGDADVVEHHRIRRAVFVDEQGIFGDTDVDAHDARGDVLHVLARVDGVPAGTVRLFPVNPGAGVWQGDRLAVLPGYRTAGVGAPLVRFAVATADALGGDRMVAHVQPANRRFFERLGWRAGSTEIYAGHPHVAMDIVLGGGEGSVP